MAILGVRKTVVLGDETSDTGISVTSAADIGFFTPGQPVDIVRWGIIADTLIDVGAGMVIKADHRITAGSDTGRTDGTVGDLTFGTDEDIAQGDGVYTEVVSPGVTGFTKTPFEVDPGEQVVFQVTDQADTAGTCRIFVEFIEKPFVGDSARTAGTYANRIGAMTSND